MMFLCSTLQYFPAMREALHLRMKLLPYIYTSARRAFDTGIRCVGLLLVVVMITQRHGTVPSAFRSLSFLRAMVVKLVLTCTFCCWGCGF